MGYTAAGGPKGLGQFNDTPQTAADLNKAIELIAQMGNYRGDLTEAQRDALSGGALYAGLLVFNTTAGRLERYDGSGWSTPGFAFAMATGSYTVTSLAANGGNSTGNITFPAGRFSVPPLVFVQPASPRYGTSIINSTVSGCQIFTQNFSPAAPGGVAPQSWLAIQMLPGTAAG